MTLDRRNSLFKPAMRLSHLVSQWPTVPPLWFSHLIKVLGVGRVFRGQEAGVNVGKDACLSDDDMLA